MKRIKHLITAGLLLAAVQGLHAQGVGDCDFYENWYGAEPSWYAAECGVDAPTAAPVDGPQALTDPAHALNISTFGPNPNTFIQHPLNDFANFTVEGGNTRSIFAMESSADGTTIYAIDNDTFEFGTVDPASGTFTALGTSTPLTGHTWTGLAINATTSLASSTDGTTSTLYSIDLADGTVTEIGSQTTTPLLIDIAITCTGDLYGHDIGSDTIFSIDPTDGSATAIGPTGIDANFAQGMTVDRDTGTIFAYGYTGGGTNTYGSVDTGTGAITPISVDNPLGEWEGATSTACGAATSVPTLSLVGLGALLGGLLLIGVIAVRSRAG